MKDVGFLDALGICGQIWHSSSRVRFGRLVLSTKLFKDWSGLKLSSACRSHQVIAFVLAEDVKKAFLKAALEGAKKEFMLNTPLGQCVVGPSWRLVAWDMNFTVACGNITVIRLTATNWPRLLEAKGQQCSLFFNTFFLICFSHRFLQRLQPKQKKHPRSWTTSIVCTGASFVGAFGAATLLTGAAPPGIAFGTWVGASLAGCVSRTAIHELFMICFGDNRSRSVHSAYTELGLEPSAENTKVRQAYLALAKESHPDKTAGSPEKFIRVNCAYELIRAARLSGWQEVGRRVNRVLVSAGPDRVGQDSACRLQR